MKSWPNIGGALFLTLGALMAAGCQTTIVPLRPAEIGPPWARRIVPVTTRPTTQPTTAPSLAARQAAPAAKADKLWFMNLKNASTTTINDEHYEHIWHQTIKLLLAMGYRIDWRDYALGVITTLPRSGPEILQFWRPDATSLDALAEGTINTYRRCVRIVIAHEPGHAGMYRLSAEVLVEQRENPQGGVTGVAFLGSSSFGANPLPLVSQNASPTTPGSFWMRVGRDIPLEEKILKNLKGRL